jgi:hypothetical protein
MMSFHSCSFGGYGLVIIPEDRFIDIRKWTAKGKTHILDPYPPNEDEKTYGQQAVSPL